ncbi:hypothetical protein ANN_12374 [Periplaneta americana]|uniref:Uncharacterized protein n=1 Tax=Periplaneta americana TaxID=6978 RepID=A0ABQ8TGI5_PERAM|nr:hypothetical protein ANN_12374 [Periplaneta americana]
MAVPAETWSLTKGQLRRIEAAEMRLLRPLAGYTLYDHKRNADIRAELNITAITDTIESYRNNWSYFNNNLLFQFDDQMSTYCNMMAIINRTQYKNNNEDDDDDDDDDDNNNNNNNTYLLAFKEPAGSLPPSHKPAIGPYPEQD